MIRSLVALSAFSLISASATAQTSYYGGDADLTDGLFSGSYGGFDGRVFEDFTLGSSTEIFSLTGNFLYNPSAFTGATYEIRSGITNGDGGTLVASGTLSSVSLTNTGQSAFGLSLQKLVGGVTGVTLDAGTYFVAIQVQDANAVPYLATTAGANGYGATVGNGIYYWNSPPQNVNYSTYESIPTGNFSLGVNTEAVPEPASMAALGLGSLALLRRRRKNS